jgi:hypothetical protein
MIKVRNRISVILSILILTTLIGAGCTNNQSNNTANTAVENSNEASVEDVHSNLSLIITMDGQSSTYPVTIQKYSTALDALRKVTSDNNLELDTQESSYGVYVNGIAGKKGGDNNKYWLYYINGESATMSVVDYVINEGDQIEFKFE